jgi:hypothetical protein
MGLVIQADGRGLGIRTRRYCKKLKSRRERRRAKRDPECMPHYRRYWGYLL